MACSSVMASSNRCRRLSEQDPPNPRPPARSNPWPSLLPAQPSTASRSARRPNRAKAAAVNPTTGASNPAVRGVADLPCPASHDGQRQWDSQNRLDPRKCLFLVDEQGRVTGAYHQAKRLDATQARSLFHQHQWRPAKPGQPWPAPTAVPQPNPGDW